MPIAKPPKPAPTISSKTLLAANILKYRLALGLTQEELCHHAGLHRAVVGHIENARRNVTLETLDALASALNVSSSSLLASDIEAPSPKTNES